MLISCVIITFVFATQCNPVPLLSEIFKPLAIFCCCIPVAQFVSDLVRNPKDAFSHDMAHYQNLSVLWVQTEHLLHNFFLNRVMTTLLFSFQPQCEKTNILVFDQVRHKAGCAATEDGQRLEILDLGSRGIVLSKQSKQRR